MCSKCDSLKENPLIKRELTDVYSWFIDYTSLSINYLVNWENGIFIKKEKQIFNVSQNLIKVVFEI